MAELLALDAVRAGYGGAVVLEDVTLRVAAGESIAVLGRNGVGKTTLLATILGFTRLHGGSVRWDGTDAARWAPERRAASGMGWVPQERRVWRSLTVEEHLSTVERMGPWTAQRALALFPRLAQRRRHRGGELSGGEQQMLAIARALVTNPRLLLLDEPMEGLAPIVARELAGVIRSLAGGDMAVILVEQQAAAALALAQRALVMERGRIVHDGAAAELAADRARLEAMLAP